MYTKVRNPMSGRQVSIYSKLGKKILKNYLKQIGGDLPTQCGIPSVVPNPGEYANAKYHDGLCRNQYDSSTFLDLNDENRNDIIIVPKGQHTYCDIWDNIINHWDRNRNLCHWKPCIMTGCDSDMDCNIRLNIRDYPNIAHQLEIRANDFDEEEEIYTDQGKGPHLESSAGACVRVAAHMLECVAAYTDRPELGTIRYIIKPTVSFAKLIFFSGLWMRFNWRIREEHLRRYGMGKNDSGVEVYLIPYMKGVWLEQLIRRLNDIPEPCKQDILDIHFRDGDNNPIRKDEDITFGEALASYERAGNGCVELWGKEILKFYLYIRSLLDQDKIPEYLPNINLDNINFEAVDMAYLGREAQAYGRDAERRAKAIDWDGMLRQLVSEDLVEKLKWRDCSTSIPDRFYTELDGDQWNVPEEVDFNTDGLNEVKDAVKQVFDSITNDHICSGIEVGERRRIMDDVCECRI